MNAMTIIFKFLDFFVIVGVLFFVSKKYIIPMVEKSLREYGLFLYNLDSDCKNLQLQTQSIYENMQDQELEFRAMQHKFSGWQQRCHQLKKIQDKEQETINDLLQDRFLHRSQCLKNRKVIEKQVPLILDNVVEQLQEKYNQQDVQKQYVEQVVQFMKEQR
jgi:hypothetical protein